MSNRVNIALVLSVFCIILILGTILGAAIRINQLSGELDSLKSANKNSGSSPPVVQTQKLKATLETPGVPSYKYVI